MLEVEDLHAYYGKSHILQGVSFRVGSGEIVSIFERTFGGKAKPSQILQTLYLTSSLPD